MFDFIYECFRFRKKKKKVEWFIGDEQLKTNS